MLNSNNLAYIFQLNLQLFSRIFKSKFLYQNNKEMCINVLQLGNKNNETMSMGTVNFPIIVIDS